MLNYVLSYSTMILIDKKGQGRKIHTDYGDPKTLDKFVVFNKEFIGFTERISNETY